MPAVSSVSHSTVYTPSPDIPTTIVNIPHPSVISAPLLKSLHSTTPAVLPTPAPTQPVAKVGIGTKNKGLGEKLPRLGRKMRFGEKLRDFLSSLTPFFYFFLR